MAGKYTHPSALQAFHELGIPIEPDTSEGPVTTLLVLGIEVDTVAMQLHLPADKLCRLQEATKVWRGHKCCTKREHFSHWVITTHSSSHKTSAILHLMDDQSIVIS